MRYRQPPSRGFTLVEVLIVVVIMAILAGVAIPNFVDYATTAKANTAKFNLAELRSQLELYRQHHDGRSPSATLAELLVSTNSQGVAGVGAAFPYGPYFRELPVNPLNHSAVVRLAGSDPPSAASGAADAGWLYDQSSGGIWIDDPSLLSQ